MIWRISIIHVIKIFEMIDVHLTNVAVQKTSDNYDDKLGGKWNLQTLKLFMMSKFTIEFNF